MKSFKDFLIESAKTYNLRIKIAGPVTDTDVSKMEASFEKWGLESLSKPSRTPIQEHPIDFPKLSNVEVHLLDVVLNYPTTPDELANCIHLCTGIDKQNIVVYNENAPSEVEREEKLKNKDSEYKTLLGSDYDESESDLPYGDEFTKKFLNDLEKLPKLKINANKTSKAKTTNDLPQGNVSPVGSTKNKKPTAKSFAR